MAIRSSALPSSRIFSARARSVCAGEAARFATRVLRRGRVRELRGMVRTSELKLPFGSGLPLPNWDRASRAGRPRPAAQAAPGAAPAAPIGLGQIVGRQARPKPGDNRWGGRRPQWEAARRLSASAANGEFARDCRRPSATRSAASGRSLEAPRSCRRCSAFRALPRSRAREFAGAGRRRWRRRAARAELPCRPPASTDFAAPPATTLRRDRAASRLRG
jgi:hypothetical protein